MRKIKEILGALTWPELGVVIGIIGLVVTLVVRPILEQSKVKREDIKAKAADCAFTLAKVQEAKEKWLKVNSGADTAPPLDDLMFKMGYGLRGFRCLAGGVYMDVEERDKKVICSYHSPKRQ